MRSILGIDTSSPLGSIALLIDGVIAATASLPPGGHSTRLAVVAEALARDAGIGLAGLTGIAVSGGPGSFTGLRIGLAWAKGIALAAGVPLAMVSTHEAAAHAAADAAGIRITVTPGERREVAIAVWARATTGEAPDIRPSSIAPPRSVPELDAADAMTELAAGRPYTAIPTNESIAALLESDGVPHVAPRALAASVARLGDALLRAGGAADIVTASPTYGRAPNARKPSA
jgi:tRNA threonylcarbamoyladenosine biosynthesis protein TsaB